MTPPRWVCAFPAVLALAVLLPRQAETAEPPSFTPTSTIALDGIGDLQQGQWKWSHGAFLHAVGAGGLSPTFYTLSREGRFVSSITPQISDTTAVSLIDFDRAPDGSIVYTGQSASAYGGPQPFLVYLSPTGETTHLIATAPYWPWMLTIAPDGTVWTVGFEMVRRQLRAPELNPQAGVLRHFDQTGKLLQSDIPQSRFTTPLQSSRLNHGFLVATRDRLSWYTPKYNLLAERSEYVEISPGSQQTQHYLGLPPPTREGFYTGFAVTDAGQVFVSYEDHTNPQPRPPDYHLRTVYRLDRSASHWIPVLVPEFGPYPDPHLIGAEGDQLVFRSGYSAAFFRVSP